MERTAVMAEGADRDVKTIHDLAGIVKRRRRDILLPAFAVFGLAVLSAVLLPRTYRSATTILIEEQEVPREYVGSNITSFADQRLQTINQRIMSTTKLLEVISRFNLYADKKDKITMDEIVAKMRKDIKFNTISADVIDPRTGRPAQATIAFSIAYEGKDPETVLKVANELASLYLEENLKSRERQSAETSKFMDEEMKEVKAKLADLDARMAAYKERNVTSLPELAQVNLQGLDQVEREIARLDDQQRTLKEREGYLQQQLSSIPPDTASQEKENLKELRARLVDLKSRFSDEYPDVIKTKSAIRELEARLKEHGGVVPGTRPDNPAYITLASQLAGTKSDIESVKRQIGELRGKRDLYRRRIEASPRVEEGYRGLLVERNNTQSKYDELTKKAMDAKVAHGLEKEQLGERFSIVDAARLPEKPASPNVPAILLIGLILGLGGGVGVAAVKESADDTARTPEGLTRAVGFPVLASIPEIVTRLDVEWRRDRQKYIVLFVGIGAAAIVALFHFFVMDLELLWVKIARKLAER
jgi:polysaccharide chain length determinant protein (PEP-CTERM system associated)